MRTLLLLSSLSLMVGCPPPNDSGKDTGERPTDLDADGFSSGEDCNDNDANVNPAATEVCDGQDNNCDALTDDADPTVTGGSSFYADADGDGAGAGTGVTACTAPAGHVTNDEDCNDTDGTINPDASEVCDSIDNDCDGLIDDADPTRTGGSTFYADRDNDGFGDQTSPIVACTQPNGYVNEPVDCDDRSAAAYPGGAEVCDGVDNDCDGNTDDADADVTGQSTFYADNDLDGHGTVAATIEACTAPSGYAASSDDCDDTNSALFPGNAEICDGQDNNCDALADDDDPNLSGAPTWYQDNDGDGFGDGTSGVVACASLGVTDGNDCDDLDPFVNPDAIEVCDSGDVDEDCNGVADDADLGVVGAGSWYTDADGDGYGTGSATVSCEALAGEAPADGDCDDADATLNPGAEEVCDTVDNDCDGLIDDNDTAVVGGTWYIDRDGDGAGDPDTQIISCSQPSGYVANANDPLENSAFSALSATTDLSEAIDVAANATSLYAVGINAAGEAAVVGVDLSTGAITEIYSGDPLVQPTGLALSPDGTTLYVADAAADTAGGDILGDVFAVDVQSGSLSELGAGGVVDMPGDVAVSPDGLTLYITGRDDVTANELDGFPAIFSMDANGGTPVVEHVGSPLVEPLALAVSPDGATVYVVDGRAASQKSALLAISNNFSSSSTLATGFKVAFPAGLAVSEDGGWLFYSHIQSSGITGISRDGSTTEELSTSGLKLPTGVASSGLNLYFSDVSDSAAADIYTLSY
jgi:Putative metal-binding motif